MVELRTQPIFQHQSTHSQHQRVVHPPMTPGDPAKNQKLPKIPSEKQPVSWACFQVMKIKLQTFQIHTQIIFSESAHPILKPRGGSPTSD